MADRPRDLPSHQSPGSCTSLSKAHRHLLGPSWAERRSTNSRTMRILSTLTVSTRVGAATGCCCSRARANRFQENIALDYGEDYEPKEMQPSLSQCYSCGSACLDASARPPAGESSHWFLDVHDGVRRKVAYLFCWECVGLFLRQLQRPPHPGCGHLPSLSLPSCAQECQLMFCDRCRVEIGQQVRSPPQGRV